MSFSRERLFSRKIFQAGALAKILQRIAGDNPMKVGIYDSEDLPDGGSVSHDFGSLSQLSTVCDIGTHHLNVNLTTSSGESRSIFFRDDDGLMSVHVFADTTDDLQTVFDMLITGLALEEASDELQAKHLGPTRKVLSDRLAIIERIILGPNRKLRCFLSYRFTAGHDEPARKLREFLALLDIDVVTGDTYEPRAISRKIIDRLNDNLDFVILLIGKDGESFWTRDEIATANNKLIPLIPVVEEGATFSSGLFGDLEHITYGKGHISDSFLKILEAIKYLRQKSLPADSSSSH